MTDDSASDTLVADAATDLIRRESWDIPLLYRVRKVVFPDRNQLASLRAWANEQSEDDLRGGLAKWVLGAYDEAEDIFASHQSQPHVKALLGMTLTSLGREQEVLALLANPANAVEAAARAEALVRCGRTDADATAEIEAMVKNPGLLAGTAWPAFLKGWLAERALDSEAAIKAYAEAHESGETLPLCTFHLARLLELKGCDEEALDLYEEYLYGMPPNPAVLTNLGVLYEDLGEYSQAEACFRTILKAFPNHERARLYLADVEASKNMLYDEDQERREDKRNAIMRTPVTDFELSVRSRNCLVKMGIRTLGDLVQKTEAELLSYKNFGETSLMEIQQILTSKNLRLGMDQDELAASAFGVTRAPSGDLTDPRNRPIAELELSVRSRRVVDMFKLRTIGDLSNKTEAELMACPNFGQTSLNEIKSKLDELGLALKG